MISKNPLAKILVLFSLVAGLASGCDVLPQVISTDPTETATPLSLPSESPTAFPTPTVEIPTSTATITPVVVAATETPQPAITLAAEDMEFELFTGSPVFTANFAHPEAGCGWMGIAGQVFDAQAKPMQGLVVVAEGYLQEAAVEGVSLSGSATSYGPGGYEIVLANLPVESNKGITLSLFDLEGNLLAPRVALDTYADCGKNLILINFQQKPTE